MKALYLKNLRCFAEPGWIPLAPVTLLIGENSSGKTTFLAAARLASDLADERRKVLDFNEDPFRLGAFEQLAHHKGGRGGRAATFELGIERTELLVPIESSTASGLSPLQSELVRTRALFDDVDGQPRLIQTSRSSNGLSLTRGRPFAFAPIRSEPQRTFDRMMSVPQPSGAHVPMLLAQFDGQRKWAPLRKAIDQFGKSSGLFQKLEVKQLGRSKSSPFQLYVRLSSSAVNLMDVGYGVSQALPLVFDILRAEDGQIFLLQQPEVHLHPRAQAAFGSLLLQVAKSTGKQFLVETHSDHIVDRVRMDVRDKKGLTPDDVVILYFEREGAEAKIYPIRVDKAGNLQGVPPGYRRFFLEEERRFLSG